MRSVPLILLACFITGLFLARHLPGATDFMVTWTVCLASVLLVSHRFSRRLCVLMALCLCLLGLGYLRLSLWQSALPGTLSAGHIELVGRIEGDVTSTLYSTRMLLAAERPASGKVRVTLRRSGEVRLDSGDRVMVSGQLVPVAGPTNPHGWDGRLYWYARGVYWELREAVLLRHAPNPRRPLAVTVRRRLEESLELCLPAHQVGLMRALLLGDRSGLHPALYQQARRAGIAHLFAVSGLHVGMVGAAAAQLAVGMGAKGCSLAVGMVAILGYGAICGASPSIVRSGSMYLSGWLLRPIYKENALLISLCLSAFLILLLWPGWLASVGFQLSFGAVLGIVLWAGHLEQWLSFLPRRAAQTIAVTTAVQLMTTPAVAYHFGEVSFSGLLVNPVAMPLALVGVMGGLMVALCGVFLPLLGALGGRMVSLILTALSACAQLGSRLPFSAVPVRMWSAPEFVLYFAALGLLFSRLAYRRYLAAILVALLLIWPHLTPQTGMEVIFFDVGHGDAILFRVEGGPTLLVDTGPGGPSPAAHYSIIPYLRALGVGHIDVLAITHAHDDHYGGAQAILEQIPCRLFIYSAQTSVCEWPPLTLKELVRQGGGKVQEAVTGHRLRLGPLDVEVLHPPPGFTGDENDSSLVLRVTFGHWSALLTGDISVRVEDMMMTEGLAMAADVLKVAHHGSSTSSGWAFLKESGAQHAVISSGERFGHPAAMVVERLEATGMQVWRTDQQGAIIMVVGKDGYRVYGFAGP